MRRIGRQIEGQEVRSVACTGPGGERRIGGGLRLGGRHLQVLDAGPRLSAGECVTDSAAGAQANRLTGTKF